MTRSTSISITAEALKFTPEFLVAPTRCGSQSRALK